MNIQISTTDAIFNKQPDKLKSATWQARQITRRDFALHVLNGKAFAVGTYTDNRRVVNNFIQSQVIGIDIDGAGDKFVTLPQLLDNPFIKQYAGLIYASPSWSPEMQKWRVVFYLDAPITNAHEYTAMVNGLIGHLSQSIIGIDPVAKDCSRLFFGHDVYNRRELWWSSANTLPITVIEPFKGVLLQSTSSKPTNKKRTGDVKLGNRQFSGELRAKLPPKASQYLNKLMQTQVLRNNQLYFTARRLNDMGIESELAYSALFEACTANGYIAELGDEHFNSTFTSAYGNEPSPTNDVSFLNNTPFTVSFIKNAKNVMTLDLPYITQMSDEQFTTMMNHALVTIKSPTGSGKTTLIKSIEARFEATHGRTPRIIAICHRRALVQSMAEKLGYKTYDNDDFKGSVVTTVDSLFKYNTVDVYTDYDMVIIDEAVQTLSHLASSSTLKDDRITPLKMIMEFINRNVQVIAMDANFTGTVASWLESKTNKPSLRVYNKGLPATRYVDICEKRSTAFGLALQTAKVGFTTVACVSRTDAHLLERMALTSGISVYVVSSDTTDNKITDNLIMNVNSPVVNYQMVIYTPSLGTGVDITRDVETAFLIGTPRPLTGDELVQMISRARNAKRYVVCGVKANDDDDSVRVPPEQLYTDKLEATSTNELSVDAPVKESAKLWALLQSDKRNEFADKKAFIRSALQNGFKFREMIEGDDIETLTLMRGCREEQSEWKRLTTLSTEPLSDDDVQRIRGDKENNPTVRCGNERFHIEQIVGRTISDELYESIGTKSKRWNLRNFADLLETRELVADDDERNRKFKAIQDIELRLKIKDFGIVLFARLGVRSTDDFAKLQNLTADELLNDDVRDLLTNRSDVVRKVFGRYRQTDNLITELRAILRFYGVKLTSQSRKVKGTVKRVNGKRTSGQTQKVYSVDLAHINHWLDLAKEALDVMRKRRDDRMNK